MSGKSAKFQVGQLIHHRLFDYRGVIYDVDPDFQGSEEWYRTVARSRFSTPTIGREHLVGRRGVAVTAFGPNGHVEVDGARWQAAAHREAGLEVGDEVEVVGVDGLFLEVEPVDG